MQDDDELCLCFHVTQRKIKNFIRIRRPRVASQLSECGGAGTGCGWCRPMLRRLLERAEGSEPSQDAAAADLWHDPAAYAAGRQQHLRNRD